MSSVPADFDRSKLKDRSYKGDDYKVNTDLNKGPFDQRRCTDVLCLFIFWAFFGFMFYMIIWGYVNGDPAKLLAPVSGDGQFCGQEEGLYDYPYLYIFDITAATTTADSMFEYGVCVNECPATASSTYTCVNTTLSAAKGGCENSSPLYGTHSVYHYCIPDQDNLPAGVSYNTVLDTFLNSSAGTYVMDLYKARWVILTCIGIAVVFAFLYIHLLHHCATILCWTSIVLVQCSLIGGGIWCYHYRTEYDITGSVGNGLWWGTWICWVSAGLYYVIILCNFKSLRVAIAIIDTTADFFADTKRIVFVPIGYFIFGIILFLMWFAGIICVGSVGNIQVMSVETQLKTIEWDTQTESFVWIMFFGIIWIFSFLIAANEFVIIVSACTWYFSDKTIEDSDGIAGDADVWKGFYWSVRYHQGSLAFGSFLLAVVWVIRLIFEYVGNKMHEASGSNKCTECLFGCIRCCLDCFDRFIRYLNRNAYIYMAITSESFCESALNSFLLILKNMMKFAFVEGVGGIFMFLAKFCVAAFTTFAGFCLLKWMIPSEDPIQAPLLPILFIFLMSYVVAAVFISVFDTSANTILQCYLIDKDIQNQTGKLDQKHVADNLQKFLEEHCKDENADRPANQEPLLDKENQNQVS